MRPKPLLTAQWISSLLGLLLFSATSLEGGFLEDADQKLSLNLFQDRVQLRLSGLLDLEGYFIDQRPPALIESDDRFLFNPRLSVFLDAQLGSYLYGFAQARLDRGFDPSDKGAQVRLDEYFLRFSPLANSQINLQVGQFATVVGNWVLRHDSWLNPLINAPLPYENPTAIWHSLAPDEADTLLYWAHVDGYDNGDYSDKIFRLPVIWGPSYASGFALFGSVGAFDYAAEIKNTALAQRPKSWSVTEVGFEHPTFSGRVGFRPNEQWTFGFSASSGTYLLSPAESTLPPGKDIGDYREFVLAQDISFQWRHWQLWAEVFETRFEVPNVGDADTLAYYIEAKYKITAQLFGALRWNQQFFGTIPDEDHRVKWGKDIWRVDAALGYRFTNYLQAKLQYSFSHQNAATQEGEQLVAGQLTLKF